MIVTAADATDAEAMAAVHALCFDEPWDAAALYDLLQGPGVFAFAVKWDAIVLARAAAGEAEILTLATAPEVRRQGSARALIVAAATEAHRLGARELFLEVGADNASATALYSSLSFAVVGRRSHYYVRPAGAIDALTLRAALPLSATSEPDMRHGADPRG